MHAIEHVAIQVRVLELIESLDKDGDGKVSTSELIGHIEQFVAVEGQKRVIKRMLYYQRFRLS